jgi:4-alpha-glucanotransferase
MSCNFIFCLHDHQPVGNFDHIFKWAYETSYLKTLEILNEYPDFRFAIHHSGPLFEWIKKNNPEYLHLLKSMNEKKQVELISGGFYEPIFSIITENDIKEQLSIMQDFCIKEFNTEPSGFWTAERVWDPEIPNLVSGHNLKYTLLDDIHFRYAGIDEKNLYGYYITERLNNKLFIYPIDKFLRYSIPFKLPEETTGYFRRVAESNNNPALIYGDDGEKFGLWPGTSKWVFDERWLRNFIESVLRESWIKMTHPSEFIAANDPIGRVYLPQGSYYELSEWALPSNAAVKLVNLNRDIKSMGRENDFYPFVKGGVWNNFLIKYPESNAVNKRTILLSREISEFSEATGDKCFDIFTELYKSECNCAYWHGLFGGIYLTHLRHALYEHLLTAEKKYLDRKNINSTEITEADFWNEGRNQILIRNRNQSLIILPYLGGTVSEFGLYNKAANIFDVIQRRYEAYHETLKNYNDNESNNSNNQVASIHDRITVKEKNLRQYLVYDSSRRYSFKDLIFEKKPGIRELIFEKPEMIDCSGIIYEYNYTKMQSDTVISLSGKINHNNQKIIISKNFFISDTRQGLKTEYSLAGNPGIFGVEININLLGSHDEDTYYEIPGLRKDESFLDIPGKTEKIKTIRFVDKRRGINVNLISSIKADFLRYPVFTVSQSDTGFEKNYQGSSVLILFDNLQENQNKFSIELSVD